MGLLKFARHPGTLVQSAPTVFRKQKPSRFYLPIILLLGFVLAGSPATSWGRTGNGPQTLVSVRPQDWEVARNQRLHASLQILFPTNSLQRMDSIFSDIFFQLPEDFPEFKLNTIGRGWHSSLLYLPELSLDEIRELTAFLTGLDPAILNLPQYDLLRPVKAFDADRIEVKTIGHENFFLALKPHQEFVQWQMRFWHLIQDRLPHLAAKHRAYIGGREVTEDGVHFSLIQWGKSSGLEFSAEKIEAAKALMRRRIAQAVRRYQNNHGGAKPEVIFDLRKISLELVTAPISIHSLATPIVAFRAGQNGRIEASDVGRIRLPEGGAVVEFDVQKLLAGDPTPYEPRPESQKEWMGPKLHFPALTPEQFLSALPPALRAIIAENIRLGRLSPTRMPAPVPTDDPESQGRYFVTSYTHPMLAPEKGIPVLKMIEKFGLRSTADTFIGTELYASSVRREVRNPGDSDVLINSLIMVPDSITTLEQARDYVVEKFLNDVLGPFARIQRQGRGTFTELRTGSDVTMGLPYSDIVDAYEENPYLSPQDILNGTFLDKARHLWPLRKLIRRGDFTKGKFDFYPHWRSSSQPGEREEISLQFLVGYQWRGNTFALQRNGMKGVPAQPRTAVSGPTEDDPTGLVSYAVGAAISYPLMLSSIQRGSLLPYAVRDAITYAYPRAGGRPPVSVTPLWNPKFIKKIYNLMILLNQSSMGLDEFFFKQVKDVLTAQGRWNPEYTLVQFRDAVTNAIDPQELGLLNTLRRNINDYREYNERHWPLPSRGWVSRAEETSGMLRNLDEKIKSGILRPSSEFRRAYAEFRRVFNNAKNKETARAVRYFKKASHYEIFKNFENQLKYLESEFVIQQVNALSRDDRAYIETLVAYSPHILVNYMDSRSKESEERMLWSMQVMKMAATPANLALLRQVSHGMVGLPSQQMAAAQSQLFKRDHNAPRISFPGSCGEALGDAPEDLTEDQLEEIIDSLD